MSLPGRVRNWFRSIISRGRLEREMIEEMGVHVEEAAVRFRARGMSESEALLAARREFGQPGVVQEEARDARGSRWVESTASDIRYAIRHYARTPLTSATIVLTLTLGIGATASMYSVMDGLINRPPPGIPDDPSLVLLRGLDVDLSGARNRSMSWAEVSANAGRTDRFASVAAWTTAYNVLVDVTGEGGEGLSTVRAQFVSPNFFRGIGSPLASGPGFVQTRFDDLSQPELTVVVTEAFAERTGGAASAVGRQVKVNGAALRIVGVTPHRFNGPVRNSSPHTIWIPLSADPAVAGSTTRAFADRDSAIFRAVARLQPGTSMADASTAVQGMAASFADPRRVSEGASIRGDAVSLRGNAVPGEIVDMQGIVSGVVTLLVLLLCTTTVSSLLIGSAESRRSEIGVRLALGASRGRVARQLLTETGLLALAGGALGLILFAWVCELIGALVVDIDIAPDWATAVFTLVSAVVTTMLCGLSPALHATRSGVSEVIKSGGPGATQRSRLQRTFVVAQLALTQPLLVGVAMMMLLSLRGLGPQPGDAVADRVIRLEFSPTQRGRAAQAGPVNDVMRRLAAFPGVTAVIPGTAGYGPMSLESDGQGSTSGATVRARGLQVPPDYFRTLGVEVVRGREFEPADTLAGARKRVLIGSVAARRLFGAATPVGQRLHELGRDGTRVDEIEIVGVVDYNAPNAEKENEPVRVYLPLRAVPGENAVLIRTDRPAEPLLPSLRAIIRSETPLLPIQTLQTLEQADRQKRDEVMQEAAIAASGGLIALLLASVGLYAVVSIAVGQRRREIGVRVAIGASPREVVGIFMRGGLRLCVIGLVIGLPLSAAAVQILRAELAAPRANMPVVAVVIAVAVVAVAALATWLPARTAAGVDPLVALRAQ
jgi:predicted permease